jgi:hypothetical protein
MGAIEGWSVCFDFLTSLYILMALNYKEKGIKNFNKHQKPQTRSKYNGNMDFRMMNRDARPTLKSAHYYYHYYCLCTHLQSTGDYCGLQLFNPLKQNQPTKRLTKGGVRRRRETSSLAGSNRSCVRNALLEMVNGALN